MLRAKVVTHCLEACGEPGKALEAREVGLEGNLVKTSQQLTKIENHVHHCLSQAIFQTSGWVLQPPKSTSDVAMQALEGRVHD